MNAFDRPMISVVAPVWNAEQTLRRCITGVLSQDYPPTQFEAIFVDNRSRDRSLQILEQYKDRIAIVEEKKQGASAARNAGVRSAKSEYIAFIDADSVPDKNWLRELVACAAANPSADFVGGRIAAYDPQSPIETFVELLYDQRSAIEKFHPPYTSTANLFIKRERLLELGLFNETLLRGEDVDLSYRGFFKHNAKFAYAHKAAVFHPNMKTLWQLFLKGLDHGQVAAHLWKRYEQELQLSRLRRCADIKPYLTFVRRLAPYLRIAVRKSSRHANENLAELRYPFYDGAFNVGKQLGFLAGTLRYR